MADSILTQHCVPAGKAFTNTVVVIIIKYTIAFSFLVRDVVL